MQQTVPTPTTAPAPRKGMPSPRLCETEFKSRFRAQFIDPNFDSLQQALDDITQAAWDAYEHERKAPRTVKAGAGYADPDYDLAEDWVKAKAATDRAQADYESSDRPQRVLLVNGSSRSEHTCPGEMSKSFRMIELAQIELEAAGIETEVLDLSRTVSEYGRNIHPCKACFSTAAPLCHFPCSCYPNYSLGQSQDWMNEIYPMWLRADAVLIVSPVNWYQVSSPLKAMMDRMVCFDGGNPDPSLTQGKKADIAKQVELDGWDYPRRLKGRLFAVIVHGDVEGTKDVRRSISDWLKFMDMAPAGPKAELDRYIGYWEPYATNHEALDKDLPMQGEVRNVARTLRDALLAHHDRKAVPGSELVQPRNK
ncbi:Multimeric flavodoxin WrbA [Devosia sp. YR412]|uniref:flavodoxin family protein n=1 Tax=Devosia sp. YR412 TaxID=1881030 RepID=UPI0008B2C5BE|nr:flavodoxin family protein [Devosia sp. YR412]SEP81062.1 Multimeric flavodoxin WrbA [Devosia sp. YR412]